MLLFVLNCFALSWPGSSCKWELVLNLPTWLNKGEIKIHFKKWGEWSPNESVPCHFYRGLFPVSPLWLPSSWPDTGFTAVTDTCTFLSQTQRILGGMISRATERHLSLTTDQNEPLACISGTAISPWCPQLVMEIKEKPAGNLSCLCVWINKQITSHVKVLNS